MQPDSQIIAKLSTLLENILFGIEFDIPDLPYFIFIFAFLLDGSSRSTNFYFCLFWKLTITVYWGGTLQLLFTRDEE